MEETLWEPEPPTLWEPGGEEYRVTMRQTPPSWNEWIRKGQGKQGIGWRTRLYHEWHEEFKYRSRHIPKDLPRVEIWCRLTFNSNRGRDGDNYTTYVKLTKDAMKREGIIEDDRPKFVKESHEPELVYEKGCIPRTEILIRVVPGPRSG